MQIQLRVHEIEHFEDVWEAVNTIEECGGRVDRYIEDFKNESCVFLIEVEDKVKFDKLVGKSGLCL